MNESKTTAGVLFELRTSRITSLGSEQGVQQTARTSQYSSISCGIMVRVLKDI